MEKTKNPTQFHNARKKKYVHNQKAAVQKQNEDISKAARELLRKKHR